MSIMMTETARHLAPVMDEASAPAEILAYAIGDCGLGRVLVARSARGVCAILLSDDDDVLAADLAARFPQARLAVRADAVRDDLAQVARFVAAPATGLFLTLDRRGTPFQRQVWAKLRAIPAGRTMTYRDLARWISPLASPRAVARACAANPIALAIPCHRVVRSDGGLAGYRWGIERKRELIRREAQG